MIGGSYLPWTKIAEYDEVSINVKGNYITDSFELYKSMARQLAWSPYKDHPHINPQKGVKTNSATELDVGKMLAEIVHFDLKLPQIPAFLMVKDNRDLVTRILNDIKNKKS